MHAKIGFSNKNRCNYDWNLLQNESKWTKQDGPGRGTKETPYLVPDFEEPSLIWKNKKEIHETAMYHVEQCEVMYLNKEGNAISVMCGPSHQGRILPS